MMRDFKEKFVRVVKRTLCILSGGCKFADGNLQSKHIPELRVTCFIQRCLKCGKRHVYAVSDSALHSTYNQDWKVNF